jgi:hypothetical protein
MTRWTVERAQEWYALQPWLVGCNFIPSNAVNQLEMWQEETFDVVTLERELTWAAGLGLNTVRVYLHDLLWQQDATGFKKRLDTFLNLAQARGIKTLFVFFDDCWHDGATLGTQPSPLPGIHNSRWLMSPGTMMLRDRSSWPTLKAYLQDILYTFANDPRVLLWDLYNEVGNFYMPVLSQSTATRLVKLTYLGLEQRLAPSASLELLRAAFSWAREVNPSQPLTSGIWFEDPRLNRYLLGVADLITFHNYKRLEHTEKQIRRLKSYGRPVICTEYLARNKGNSFQTHLPLFKREGVGCYNWGLVRGKTQTIYSWRDRGGLEPALWYHDILRPDGSPFDPDEVRLLRKLTGRGIGEAREAAS